MTEVEASGVEGTGVEHSGDVEVTTVVEDVTDADDNVEVITVKVELVFFVPDTRISKTFSFQSQSHASLTYSSLNHHTSYPNLKNNR